MSHQINNIKKSIQKPPLDTFTDSYVRTVFSRDGVRRWNLTPSLLSSLLLPDCCLRASRSLSRSSQSPWLRGQHLEPKGREEPGSSRCQNTSRLFPLFPLLLHSRLNSQRPPLQTTRDTGTMKKNVQNKINKSETTSPTIISFIIFPLMCVCQSPPSDHRHRWTQDV